MAAQTEKAALIGNQEKITRQQCIIRNRNCPSRVPSGIQRTLMNLWCSFHILIRQRAKDRDLIKVVWGRLFVRHNLVVLWGWPMMSRIRGHRFMGFWITGAKRILWIRQWLTSSQEISTWTSNPRPQSTPFSTKIISAKPPQFSLSSKMPPSSEPVKTKARRRSWTRT